MKNEAWRDWNEYKNWGALPKPSQRLRLLHPQTALKISEKCVAAVRCLSRLRKLQPQPVTPHLVHKMQQVIASMQLHGCVGCNYAS